MPAIRDGLGRSEDEAAGLDSLGADQTVGEFANEPRRASQKDDFEASARVEVNVSRGHHPIEMEVLNLSEPITDAAGVVVVNQSKDSHRLARIVGDHVLDQCRAHEPSDGFAAVRIPVFLPVFVEFSQQFATDRDAKADEGIFHKRRMKADFDLWVIEQTGDIRATKFERIEGIGTGLRIWFLAFFSGAVSLFERQLKGVIVKTKFEIREAKIEESVSAFCFSSRFSILDSRFSILDSRLSSLVSRLSSLVSRL